MRTDKLDFQYNTSTHIQRSVYVLARGIQPYYNKLADVMLFILLRMYYYHVDVSGFI